MCFVFLAQYSFKFYSCFACIIGSFLFIVEVYFIAWLCQHSFTHSFVDLHLGFCSLELLWIKILRTFFADSLHMHFHSSWHTHSSELTWSCGSEKLQRIFQSSSPILHFSQQWVRVTGVFEVVFISPWFWEMVLWDREFWAVLLLCFCFQEDASFSSGWHRFWWETSCNSYLWSSAGNISLPGCFKCFSTLFCSHLTIVFLSVFVFLWFGVLWTSCICGCCL